MCRVGEVIVPMDELQTKSPEIDEVIRAAERLAKRRAAKFVIDPDKVQEFWALLLVLRQKSNDATISSETQSSRISGVI